MIRSISLAAIKSALYKPSLVMVKNPISIKVVPFVINILITNVKIIIIKMGFNPLKINFNGTFEIPIVTPRTRVAMRNPQKSFTINREIIKTKTLIIFVLGSNLCIQESPG